MTTTRITLIAFVTLAALGFSVEAAHVHFIHQSTGDNWLRDYDEWDPDWGGGNLRADLVSDGHTVTDNWHDDDNAPYCEWDPEWLGLCALFINDGARLPDDAKAADIIIIKSCFYPTEYLTSDAVLQGWKDHSIADIVGYFNSHPEQKLVYCSSVPHHREGENCPPPAVRARGRAWGAWLEDTDTGLTSYATGGNVIGFNAFALTARPAGQADENTLRAEYEISEPDNHMNRAGNVACAARVRELVNRFGPGDALPAGKPNALGITVSPNPCRHTVRLAGIAGDVDGASVDVYDLTGRRIHELLPALGEVVWDLRGKDGSRVDPGIYLMVSTVRTTRQATTLVVLR
ncbi:hypothetical protein JXA88_04610 [Candidatus Fermentibacteria bacterium]|nr:hypothetical protein [Candidatus Fermentibacteria bacterium]